MSAENRRLLAHGFPARPRGFSAHSVVVALSKGTREEDKSVRSQRLLQCAVLGSHYKKVSHKRRCDLTTPEHRGNKR